MPKKTEATSNADADAADAGPFFSHTCVYIIMRYKSGISHQRLLPLKRCMPYYHLMRISRLMQAMLFRNFFNFLFSKSYHPLPVLPPVFLSFFLTLPRLFFFSIIGTRTCVRKKDLRLPRLRLKYFIWLSVTYMKLTWERATAKKKANCLEPPYSSCFQITLYLSVYDR